MVDFERVETYNAADETINFGSRVLSDDSSLREITTLASIPISDQGRTGPHINAVTQGSIYLSVNTSFGIFKDRECSNVVFNATFQSIVDSFCVSPQRDFLVICLRDGNVHLLDCNHEFNCVFSGSCERDDDGDKFFINAFVDKGCFLVVTKTGEVHRVTFDGCFGMECVHKFNFKTKIASIEYPFLVVSGTELAILNTENESVEFDGGWKFKKIFPLTHMFLALDFEGDLFKICAVTLLVFPLGNSCKIDDMEVLSDGNQKQIIAVTKDDESQQSYIQLLSYPNLEQLFSIQISNHIHLISLDSLNEEILYISKVTSGETVTQLRLQVINETEPEQRLERLLKKRKYDEAEIFAQLFTLDKALIQKARAREITETPNCTSEGVNKLIRLLETIDDDEFRLLCCSDSEFFCSSLGDVEKILTYGCQLELKHNGTQLGVQELQKTIAATMWRFQTFVTVNRNQGKALQAWEKFSECDLIQEVKLLLKNHCIEDAKIIYSRLDAQTRKELTDSDVSDILNVLNHISIATYEPFLPIFISITLSALPSSFPLFLKWTHSRVFYLENRGKANFPDNAIRFTENIVELMRLTNSADISFQRQCILHQEALSNLSVLTPTLKTLKTLKTDYRIDIPLADCLSGPQNVVRLLLNVEMCADDYDVFLKRFLWPYMVENHMQPNEIFLAEIEELVKYEESYWGTLIESILNCISSVRVRLEAVKCVLNEAKAPWSDTVRKIADEAATSSHPLAAEIKELILAEPIQVVLMRPSYLIRERKVGRGDLKFVLNRIVYCNEPTMVEDVYLLCGEDKHVGNMLLVNHFIRKGCFEKAINLLDNNTPEEVFNCAQELATMVETVVNDAVNLPSDLIDNYYEVAGCIFRRLNDNETNDFYRTCHNATLTQIRNVYNLRKHFNVKTTTHDLCNPATRNHLLEELFDAAIRDFSSGKRTLDQVFAVCQKLSLYLDIDHIEFTKKLCEKTADYGVILKAAQRVGDSDASAKDLCSMAALLLKYSGTYKVKLLDDSFDSESMEVVGDEVFLEGMKLARELMGKATCNAEVDEEATCMELGRWVQTSSSFTRTGDSELKKKLFGDVFDVASVPPGFLTFSTIRNVFVGFSRYLSGLNNPGGVDLVAESPLTEEDFFKELKLLPPILENLSKEGQHFTSYNIVQTLQDCMMQVPNPNTATLKFLNDVLKKKCVPKVLASILSNNVVDENLLYGLLLLCDRDDAAKFVVNSWKMYKRHPKKFACITRIGLKLWDYHKISQGKSEMLKSLTIIKWWKKFEGKKLDYDVFFKMKSEERFELLVNSDCLDVGTVKEYCHDFKLEVMSSYKLFLMNVLVNWKPEYEISSETHAGSRKHLVVKNSESDLLQKCHDVINLLDREHVLHIVMTLWKSVNTYYYEVFLAMLDILSRINSDQENDAKRMLLIFLKDYQRVSKPSETEIEHWFTNYPDTQSIDVLSEFRLSFSPLLFTDQIFNIIRPEINLATYKRWFDAIDILKPYLTKNTICSFVMKDVVASGVLSRSATKEWVLCSKHDDLFKEIDECVMNISDLELATSVMYHLMTHTPNGADQVAAAKLCYNYAVEYKRLNPESSDVEKAVIKVTKKYYACCGMHILHTYKLAEPKYINLLSDPKELILALFLDERILNNGLEFGCPEIHTATEALAALFNLDIKKIRHELIHSSLGHEDILSSPLNFDSSIVYTNGACTDDENLDRIAYICCNDDLKYWQVRLYNLGTGTETEEQLSVHCKARALKVLAMISDSDTIVNLTECTYDEFINFIDKLTVVSNLEYLGISLDVAALHEYNKKELLNRLVRRSGSILGIKTMALICMTFSIDDVKVWEFIVNNAVAFSLFVELKTYLNFLKKGSYQNENFYVKGWQKLVDHSFAHLSSSNHDDVLLTVFLTIQSCPVLFSLNLDNAFRRCMDNHKPEFAAVLLQYLDGARRDEYVAQIRHARGNLGAKLAALERKGLWGISYVKTILG